MDVTLTAAQLFWIGFGCGWLATTIAMAVALMAYGFHMARMERTRKAKIRKEMEKAGVLAHQKKESGR